MFRINFNFVVYRYEAILAIAALILAGSFVVSARDSEYAFASQGYYPYTIALTFDDGPHKIYTDKILDILAGERVPATFFLVGSRIVENPSLVRKISDLGFEIDAHTYSHRNMSKLSDGEIADELLLTRNLIKSFSGQESAYFRPPGGQYNERVLSIAGNLKFSMVLWTVFTKDHEEENPGIIVKKVLAQANNGGVVLLHSGRLPTIEALPEIIRELRSRGYRFVTISELEHSDDSANTPWLKNALTLAAKKGING
ncbi:MAG TPA: hypothetical protein DEE98_04750 [Elusimicrobia bacterium]|nr:MAG: hypothetical protein A2278_04435 [Elusimicrobia bacterium RIFOXYA12_FULL_49_49]OGS10480.1 MAG: hypothetical protein A2386_05230 [Elusimicrobia bacterium RIFOXYB1_FULL_48_9]OGS14703.1 MAG: hypothetical protein A2251_09405 [Elusimicrobia bacterium RIFOXYA2_FULL_47_53]OGS25645.1 MAG: hypothetical protein A2339_06185 [Elusimicrobia bacterium RIFOXYB12_FULL_50_12]OGS31794.1 MAG: hypothetical protein A2323_06315 [Elusimicrobia bacterium RIFOXYB2_FULL_46_23]HBU69674.1 hypothetical protein [El